MRRRAVGIVGVLALGGCASLQPLRDPAVDIAGASPRVVYVTHKTGVQLMLTAPRVSGDSLIGTWEGADRELALPLRDVQRVEAVRRDKTRTTLLIAGVSVAAVAIGYQLTREWSSVRQPCNFEGALQWQGCDNHREW